MTHGQLLSNLKDFLEYLSGTTDINPGIQFHAKHLYDEMTNTSCTVKGKEFPRELLKRWIKGIELYGENCINRRCYELKVQMGISKVQVIKEIRNMHGVELVEAKWLLEAIMENKVAILEIGASEII